MITPANFPTVRISDTMPERPISSLARKMTKGAETAGQRMLILFAERHNESKRLPESHRETLRLM